MQLIFQEQTQTLMERIVSPLNILIVIEECEICNDQVCNIHLTKRPVIRIQRCTVMLINF